MAINHHPIAPLLSTSKPFYPMIFLCWFTALCLLDFAGQQPPESLASSLMIQRPNFGWLLGYGIFFCLL